MKKLSIAIAVLACLSIFRTAVAQTPTPTINGTPPPFVFTGAGVSQTGQTFTFSSGGSMTWPALPGIAACTGTPCTAWGTSYSASNLIPNSYINFAAPGDIGGTTPGAGTFTTLTTSGTAPGKVSLTAGAGSIPALAASSAGFAAPASGGTAYLYKMPATAVAGILHAATPGTVDGVNESALTSSAVNLAAEVTGQLPISAVGSAGLSASGGVSIASTGAISLSAIPIGQVGSAGLSGSGVGVASTGVITLNSQYKIWTCETGFGDGLNAFTSGTYLQHYCVNKTGVTVTITGVSCYADGGTPTLNASGTTLGALLTGAVTCTTAAAGAAGTQSANVALTNGDAIDFTFVSGSTAKQSTWIVTGTY